MSAGRDRLVAAGPRSAARRRLLQAAGLAALLAAGGARAQPQATETQVKAAYLYKFLAFVEWPAEAFATREAPIVIATVGAAELGAELARITAGRQVDGRPVQVLPLAGDTVTAGVHVLFVGADAAPRLGRLVSASEGRPLLIVTESAEGLAQGGGIGFVLTDDKVRFQVALRAIESRGLRVSARLLAVAHKVVGAPL